ncbi:MAG: polyhydroxyalkanoate synthesis repressor PhaR [Proteobacteria bacterium]|nr:MAG: polyhydroxyalkanoate synthesis repressor PhaR [Pseudomonadota bacterium]
MKRTGELRIIKKYQNRRLYDTATSTYIILEDIKQMIIDGDKVKVMDAKTERDVTRTVLLQIILEEEANATPIFSDEFLLQIIRFYGKAFQPAISPFLEQGIDMLRQTQKRFYAQLRATNPKESMSSGMERWKEFWNMNGPDVQQNIFEYLTSSTSQFIQMQENVQEQLQTQTENILNMINMTFNTNKGKKS